MENQFGLKLIRLLNFASYLFFRCVFWIFNILSAEFRNHAYNLETKLKALSTSVAFENNLLEMITIKSEDKRFYQHFGHEPRSIFRAIIHNAGNKTLHGASTIEQQLIRILINEYQRTYKRKFFELLLSTVFHNKYTKKEIIQMYLNNYPFGCFVGARNLCLSEGWDLNSLSLQNSYILVARLKYPNVNSDNYERFHRRIRIIAKRNK